MSIVALPAATGAEPLNVVVYNSFGLRGPLTGLEPERPGRLLEHDPEPTARALVRYFIKRYDTHGREVRVYAVPESDGARGCADRRRDADEILLNYQPFAVLDAVLAPNGCFTRRLAETGTFSFGFYHGRGAGVYRRAAPYAWGFAPDASVEARLTSSFVCRALAGRLARFVPSVALQSHERRFGIIVARDTASNPGLERFAESVRDGVARRCGARALLARYDGNSLTRTGEAAAIIPSFKQRGITTVLCYCVPHTDVTVMQAAASAIGYHLEWVWDGATGMDDAAALRSTVSQAHASFGVSWKQRLVGVRPAWYHAYRQEEHGEPDAALARELYAGLLLFFTAVSRAGPALSAETVERALRTSAERPDENAFVLAGGFELHMPSPQTYIDTALAWWWDPTGTPPAGNRSEGCMRVARQGLRSLPGRWPHGDARLYRAGDPCGHLGI